jgi:hypothetical protein
MKYSLGTLTRPGVLIGFLGIPLLWISILSAPAALAEEPQKVFNTGFSMMDNLKMNSGQSIYVRLSSGEELGGVVQEVGTNFLHLSELQGREFFDALIRIDDIVALIKRAKKG